MPVASITGRAGFPAVRLIFLIIFVVGLVAGRAADAALLPPPWRLAILFDREVWQSPVIDERAVPVRPGMSPIVFEETGHG